MKPYFRKAGNPASHTHVLPALRRAAFPVVLLAATALAGCATTNPPRRFPTTMRLRRCRPSIHPRRSPWSSCPGRCRCLANWQRVEETRRAPEPSNPTGSRQPGQTRRHESSRCATGFINSMQVYPWTQGALYQVYTAVGQITDIALQPGEQLVGARPGGRRRHSAAGSFGDTESGSGGNAPDPHPSKAHPRRPDDKPRHQHQHAHLSHGAALDRAHLYGVGLMAVSARPAHCAAPSERRGAGGPAGGERRRSRERQLPLCDRGRPCAVAAAARLRRRTPGLYRVSARHRSGRDAATLRRRPRGNTSELVNYRVRGHHMIVDRLFAAANFASAPAASRSASGSSAQTGGRPREREPAPD
ncbi:Type IV secretory pathway, VirB9 components [Escherichia coli]|uniref:Type IV secretory pathway, VirB9 components n=1 Tax=Escherichia coli TaxID=562 RepID=A0A377BFV6_ECOLX|nr:Type IV secretory pathway, VirB9 components [Escherichia coli]